MSNSQVQTYTQSVILKVLYTFDNTTQFLVRSKRPLSSKIIQLPQQPPHNGAVIGCIDIRKCLELIHNMSPECFREGLDYSIYSKDVVEVDEPFVGFGLYSKLMERRTPVIITGRVCKNFVNIINGSGVGADTLEVKLRFNVVNKHATSFSYSKLETSNANPSESSSPMFLPSESSDSNSETRKRPFNSLASIPQLATRTQSLPFISQNSLAHRIMMSDQNNTSLESREDAIASRFSNFEKLMKATDPPTKAKKNKSFISSVVKIGDVSTGNHSKFSKPLAVQRCVNCTSTSNPPYRFHKDGIFEFGNSGLLCNICSTLHAKNDTKKLRERGDLGVKGLVDSPYAKMSPAADNLATAARKRQKVNKARASDETISSSLATSTRKYDKLESDRSSPAQNPLTDLDPLYDSKKESPESSDNDSPINATKLNTTLIPLDDDDKENNPPADETQGDEPQSLMVHDISPSLHRLIESFSNVEQPGSPTKTSPSNEWISNLFTHDEEEEPVDGQFDDDPEVYNILKGGSKTSSPLNFKFDKTPKDKFESTPKDADTVQTQCIDGGDHLTGLLTQILANESHEADKSKDRIAQPDDRRHGLMMPSSPFFSMHQDDGKSGDGDSSRTEKISSVWNSGSSPTTSVTSNEK
ncbi:hypothetical protein KL930_001352 [Ogataea haglerorum]|uniref:Ams2/SPT21 N-terminal domain-containing protein n=1 Tax=Ogataea haglerorum TaxID=1937702 RepID=A0ABQ7RG85_9ASCO|nr:uncharacterized protein KL911_003753 [Ogataea haglerorum]KAG7698574.1 hypothetical protein KL951_001838 [Ogataea haglerorum]KAG7706354.1 hypothetical protein KL914_003249 [Ogataea haglerorum]KAG7707933.1 hypothetical protein KL950_002559 [Ogataea haglerorum]KAG7717269.1 hypothetical protein KL913_003020 [Ogataea haglerorum]KAG7719343.1 hypothetical protein KL949_002335 [Ogataea haglerorum]